MVGKTNERLFAWFDSRIFGSNETGGRRGSHNEIGEEAHVFLMEGNNVALKLDLGEIGEVSGIRITPESTKSKYWKKLLYFGSAGLFRAICVEFLIMGDSGETEDLRFLNAAALNWRFICREVRTEGGEEVVDITAGEFELPAWFENESSWNFSLWNSDLISENKAELDIAVDSRRFKIWYLRR